MRIYWLFCCSVGSISQFSMHLLEDQFVIPGKNDVAYKGQMGTHLLNYTVKGLLFKTTLKFLLFFADAVFPKKAGANPKCGHGKLNDNDTFDTGKAHDFAMLVLKVRLAEKLQNCLKQEKVV